MNINQDEDGGEWLGWTYEFYFRRRLDDHPHMPKPTKPTKSSEPGSGTAVITPDSAYMGRATFDWPAPLSIHSPKKVKEPEPNWGWIGGTRTMRYHAHYHTSGLGHIYQQRYKSFPIQDDEHFFVVCRYVERNALRAGLVDRAERWRWGSLWHWFTLALATATCIEATANRLNLESTIRPRGRQQIRFPQPPIKEA